ncbi:MAG: F420-nonreducing hydrogenase [Candidatus Hodarchaeota archaeon]
MGKPTLAIVSTTGCTGCIISILDLHEELVDVLGLVDLLYCTTILDVKEIPECDIALIDGTVANKHDIEVLKEVGKKAKTVVTLGSCACFGGISGLRNFSTREEVLDYAYKTALTNDSEVIPSEVPQLTYNVDVVENIIKVDYKIPGCPPVPSMIKNVLVHLLEGKEPKVPKSNLCEECPRTHEKMLIPTKEFLTFKVNATYEVDYREDLCFLEQGILCIGFATREGCEGRCVKANLPCRGCMGPLEKEVDQGCASICGLASIFPIGQLMNQEDLAGTVYRYSLPYSILHRVQEKSGGKNDE